MVVNPVRSPRLSESLLKFHCRLHLISYTEVPAYKASIAQSRTDSISMPDWPRSDEGVKAIGFRHSSHKLFRRFSVHANRTHPCARAHGRPIMGFSPPSDKPNQ
ncbi:hypothetical protein EVAR_101837_1 [Eumeta japonica]|uniref:Uncharacterized protein n=1 Tax=Eumeta variegata TaxID=151549 RepID=A0A4C1SQJ0_EUMVA|nr:hypothetical protein EVAR_101837_1 [Eumeta japonica]